MLTDVQLGGIAAQLALAFPSWIERRVEHVSYLDRKTVRVSEGVMFRWPEESFFGVGSRPEPGERLYVPLDLLTKRSLAGLDGMRPDGSPVPLLPYDRCAGLVTAGVSGIIWGRAEQAGLTGLDETTLAII